MIANSMFLRIILISCIIYSFSTVSKGQDYRHSLQFGYLNAKQAETFVNNTFFSTTTTELGVVGIRYNAILAFQLKPRVSWTIKSCPYFGLSRNKLSGNFQTGMEFPLTTEFYLGGIDNTSFIFGGGFSCYQVGYKSNRISGYGPKLVGGLQVQLSDNFMLGLTFGYTFGLVQNPSIINEKRMYTIGIFCNLPTN
ncbi:MAG: hypothetical protein R2780_04510 [Crocinitomicaceae bacterium]|nr:hypothetical protein [Crocinitomicaceae bacterium]